MRRRSAPAQPRAWRQRAILGNAKDAMDTRRAPWVWSASRPLRTHSALYVNWLVLDIDAFHAAFGIAGAGGGANRDHFRDRFGLLGSQPHLQCAEIFLQPLDPLGARDRDDVGALRQEPGKAELRDGAALVGRDVLDRHARVDAVLVVEVDRVDPQPLQAGFAGLLHIFGAAVDTVGAAGLAGLAEFGGDDDVVMQPLQGAAEQLLIVAPAIHVRAV